MIERFKKLIENQSPALGSSEIDSAVDWSRNTTGSCWCHPVNTITVVLNGILRLTARQRTGTVVDQMHLNSVLGLHILYHHQRVLHLNLLEQWWVVHILNQFKFVFKHELIYFILQNLKMFSTFIQFVQN